VLVLVLVRVLMLVVVLAVVLVKVGEPDTGGCESHSSERHHIDMQ
jgi:hypothetical protein